MNKIITTFVLFLVLVGSVSLGQEKTFHLKSGDTITGSVKSETDSTYIVTTSFGEIIISKNDVKPEEVFIFLKSGDKLRGIIVSESEEGITIKAQFGEVFVARDKIERIDFKSMGRARGPLARPGQTEHGRWYYGNERLIDIYFDPTGYTLKDNVLYLSGLSWGYGLSERIHITSKWGGYFFGDLNFRPKFMLFKKGDLKSEQALSIGFHFHMRGLPNKYELKDRDYVNPYDEHDSDKEWVRVGSKQNEEGSKIGGPSGDEMWWEAFGAYTLSNLKESGQGRINHTVGASLTAYPGYDLMPRAYYAVSADARRSLKLIFEVFYDPYWTSWLEIIEEKEVLKGIDFDFGFIYAYSEQLRVGIHFQRPLIAFYYKF